MKKVTKQRLWEIIFETDTRAGKAFDVILIIAILVSVLAVMLESVNSIQLVYGKHLRYLEIFMTTLFTVELIVRLYVARRPLRYAFSFFGLVDILSILPLYLSFFLEGFQTFGLIRVLRLLRIFRILKLQRFLIAGDTLSEAFKSSVPKIIVFLCATTTIVTIMGAIMFLIEGPENGFSSIPKAIYWAIVTLTTVGYGDIVPQTILGKLLSSVLMITGYGIIAVPTGLVSAEIVHQKMKRMSPKCPHCQAQLMGENMKFCSYCGEKI
jgi:voltage-gated potassium channel